MFIDLHAYEASAGSGKTFSLVVRYLSLLFAGESANKILALTFTNKAANEMQERIVNTLIDLENKGELGEIAKVLECSPEELVLKRPEVLKALLNADTKVMTLDKFFAKILRKFSLHVGLMPNFSTFDSQHELKVMARFLTLVNIQGKDDSLIKLSLLASKRLSDVFGLLNQLYAKKNEMGAISFIAQDFKSHEQMVMKSFKELQDLLFATAIGKRGRGTMEVDTIDELMTKAWIEKDTLEYWDFKKFFVPRMDELLYEIKEGLFYYMKHKESHFLAELFSLLDTYIEAKMMVASQDEELSFDDITYLVFYLLKGEANKGRIDSSFLYFRLDANINHMLLDEFQDTSTIQFEILRPLIDEMTSGLGSKERSSLFLVGDVKQSIYRFRGGKKELFYAVTDAYDVQVDQLRTNYRSEKEVVEFVNRVFIDKIRGYVPQDVKEGATKGYVEVIFNDEVLETMVPTVMLLIEQGANLNDIAVLTATNADGSKVEELLKHEGIDVVTETTSKLINQKTIKALIEYLKFSYFNKQIYARNFFSLIGQKPQRLYPCDINSPDLSTQLKKLIDKFKLYDGDMNVFYFLEKLSNYKDIEAFIYEYERLDASAAQKELNGVRVLTVHKSKGLEYEHVIVLDRLGRGSSDKSPIIYEYNGIHLENIYLRMTKRASFDENYALALEKEKKLSKEDELNALYVAFTRAKESLFIIHKSKDSKFENLALSQESYGALELRMKKEILKVSYREIKFRDFYYGTQADLLSQDKQDESDHKAIEFGLALHYTLEMMPDFSQESMFLGLDIAKNKYGAILSEDEFISIEKRISQVTNNSEFLQLTQGKIHKEKAITYNEELRYIDLLIEKEDEWIVIDYKSSISYAQAHLKQVTFYKTAITEITKSKVKAYIAYLLEDKLNLIEV
ncbi:RecB-like helicase [Sulfurimonas sp. MAG313]|nr:RecB-like helicase [Sulfurimonas sp. MAG313]MDF1880311.1 RecB-like helicase [Sulfurimonas sp. MAG313]